MRICHYAGTVLPKVGGAEMVVDALAREWANAGHAVTVLAPRPKLLSWPDDSEAPYETVRHAPFLSSRHGVEWYERHLLAAHRRRRFDVVHCHGFYPHAYLAARCKEKMGAVLVAASQGGDVADDDLRYRKPKVRDRIYWGMRRLDAMVAISRFTKTGFLRHCPRGIPVIDIPNGVYVSHFDDAVVPPTDWPKELVPGGYFSFIGRFKRRKGIDVLLRAYAAIARRIPERLALAGDGEERAALERLAQELDIRDRVHFLGVAAGDRKKYLLRNAAAGVVPSRGWEAFGLVTVETMAAGRPVVVSDLPGLADLVVPGANGFVVPPEDTGRLAACLLRLSENPDRREVMAAVARRHVTRYDWPVVAQRYLDLFTELIADRPSQRRAG